MPSFGNIGRRRQADFRNTSQRIRQEARCPSDSKGQKYGHLLALGFEEENLYHELRGPEGARKFFSDRAIAWHRTGASGDAPGVKGPTRNMASSQVACVNFLLPLCRIPGALKAVAQAIDDDVTGILPIQFEANVSPVELEWTGVGSPLEEDAAATRGALVTSVDAFMIATISSGVRAYLMEWKYVEAYPSRDYKGNGRAGETRRRRYGPLYNAAHSSFHGGVHMEEFLYEPFYQVMRLRLLADRMAHRKEMDVSEAKVVVVVPQENRSYRERITSEPLSRRFPGLRAVEEVVHAALKDRAGFATISPEALVDAVEMQCGHASSDWVAYQRERYGPRAPFVDQDIGRPKTG